MIVGGSPRRRLVVLALLAICTIGALGGVLTTPAQAKTTKQRLQELERRITVRSRALAALQRDTQRLVRAHNDLVANMDALNGRYRSLVSCVQRTPVFSWPGYTNNGTASTALDWYSPGNVFPTGTLSNPTDKIHELGVANTQACLASVAFYNPVTGGAAAAGFGALSNQEPKP